MFVPKAIQILYNGHYHWVTVVCTEGKLYLCDSQASDKLTQTLEESIRILFQNTSEDNVVTIHRLPDNLLLFEISMLLLCVRVINK